MLEVGPQSQPLPLFIILGQNILGHLQVALKYHVYSDSLWAQITEHTGRNYVTAALYYVGVELENL